MILRPAIVGLLALASCGTGPNIEGTDHDALLAHGRAYFEIAPRTRYVEPAPRMTHGIEAEFAGVQGNFEEAGSGRADYDFAEGHLAYRFGMRRKHVDLFGLGGLAFTHFDGRSSLGARVDEDSTGPLAGIQVGWRATDWLVPYARTTIAILDDDESSTRFEAGLELRPLSLLGLQVAWGHW